MRSSKPLFILIIMVNIFVHCVPPPDLPPEIIDGVSFKGYYKKEDVEYFLNFFKEMQKAVELKNTEKAFSYYSKDFMEDADVKLADLRKNTELVNKAYGKIKYTVSNIKMNIRNDQAISTDEYTYSATRPVRRGYAPLKYKGRERIYWKKEKAGWKIINWVYE